MSAALLQQLLHLHSEIAYGFQIGTVTFIRRNARAARRCLERAATLGDPAAMCSLADLDCAAMRHGDRVPRGALQLYRRAFRLGHSYAAYALGLAYKRSGRYRDSVQWFRRAHAAGDDASLLQIARAELYGIGTSRDPAAGLKKLLAVANDTDTTYYPAASGENVEAMIEIALALFGGWVLPRDYEGGRRWLRKAASFGSATAKALLDER